MVSTLNLLNKCCEPDDEVALRVSYIAKDVPFLQYISIYIYLCDTLMRIIELVKKIQKKY